MSCCVCKFERYYSGGDYSFIDNEFKRPKAARGGPALAGIIYWWSLFPWNSSWGFRSAPEIPRKAGGPYPYTGEPFESRAGAVMIKQQIRVALGLFWITADVREDKEGDCVVNIQETVLSWQDRGEGWKQITPRSTASKGDLTPTPLHSGNIDNLMIGDLETPGRNPVVPSKPINCKCTKRIVFTDMPSVPDIIQPRPPILHKDRVQPQTITVKDRTSGKSWSVSQWFQLTSKKFTFKGIPSNVGANPTNLGNC